MAIKLVSSLDDEDDETLFETCVSSKQNNNKYFQHVWKRVGGNPPPQ